jgi:hypothetical protein
MKRMNEMALQNNEIKLSKTEILVLFVGVTFMLIGLAAGYETGMLLNNSTNNMSVGLVNYSIAIYNTTTKGISANLAFESLGQSQIHGYGNNAILFTGNTVANNTIILNKNFSYPGTYILIRNYAYHDDSEAPQGILIFTIYDNCSSTACYSHILTDFKSK